MAVATMPAVKSGCSLTQLMVLPNGPFLAGPVAITGAGGGPINGGSISGGPTGAPYCTGATVGCDTAVIVSAGVNLLWNPPHLVARLGHWAGHLAKRALRTLLRRPTP